MYDPLDPAPNLPGCPSCRTSVTPSDAAIPSTSSTYAIPPTSTTAAVYVDVCPGACGCWCHIGRQK